MSDNTIESDPFASTTGESDPFGSPPANSSGDSEGDFDVYDIPPIPIGVLPGTVKTCKKVSTEKNGTTKTSLVLEIACSDPQYVGAATVSLWLELPRFIVRAGQVAKAFGVPVKQQGTRVSLPKPEVFADKAALFVFSSYTDKQGAVQPTIAWGCPKPGDSELFDEWLKDSGLSDDQVNEIKKSPGVMPIGTFS